MMMMTMDQPSGSSAFGDFSGYTSDPFPSNSSSSPPIGADPDVDWSVFENADRYLLRDDSAWITRLSKDFWWNLERISEMITSDVSVAQQINPNRSSLANQKYNPAMQQAQQQQQQQKNFAQQGGGAPAPMQFSGAPPRKIVGQRSQLASTNVYRPTNNSMFNNGFASPPPPSSSSSSSSGSTIVRPSNTNNHYGNIPEKSNNFFQSFSSMSIGNGGAAPNHHEQDMEYNPFQSKISFDNHMWGSNGQQPILWQ